MILKVHVRGAPSYDVGDEIWQEPLYDAIRVEAETIADYAGSELLESPDQAHRNELRDRIIAEMAGALVQVGDTYRAPDGVLYSLTDQPALDTRPDEGRLDCVNSDAPGPVVEEACASRTCHPDRLAHAER